MIIFLSFISSWTTSSRPTSSSSSRDAQASDKGARKAGPSGELRKSESEHSLAWDAVIEQARQRALAPDAVPLVHVWFGVVTTHVVCLLLGALALCVGTLVLNCTCS